MTKVSILGATGYAGAELVKLILQHPNATLTHITSESHTGQALADVYPHMRGITDLTLEVWIIWKPLLKTAILFSLHCLTDTP